MYQSVRFVLASLLSLMACTVANAGIVLTAVQRPPATSTTVFVDLYASYDNIVSAGAFSNQAFSYRFDVRVNGITSLTATAPDVASPWSSMNTDFSFGPISPDVVPGAGFTNIRFEGSRITTIPNTNLAIAGGQSSNTLMSTISFTGVAGNSYGFMFTPVLNNDTSVAGFAYDNGGTKLPHSFSAPASFAASITAVPEPSSLALCGLAVCLGGWRMRRRFQAK